MKEKAYFVFRPRRLEDLRTGSPKRTLQEYRIVKTISLRRIDFDNFAADLLADRQFIEDNATLCKEEGDCLQITTKDQLDEILVIPWKGSFVHFAALRHGFIS